MYSMVIVCFWPLHVQAQTCAYPRTRAHYLMGEPAKWTPVLWSLLSPQCGMAFVRVRGVDERSSARHSPVFLLLAYTPFMAKETENLS